MVRCAGRDEEGVKGHVCCMGGIMAGMMVVFLVLQFLLAMLVLLGMLEIVEEFQKSDEVLRVLLSLVLAMLVIPGMSKVLEKVQMTAAVVVKMFWMFVQFHMVVVWTVVMMGFVEEVVYHSGVLGWKYFSFQSNILEAHL